MTRTMHAVVLHDPQPHKSAALTRIGVDDVLIDDGGVAAERATVPIDRV